MILAHRTSSGEWSRWPGEPNVDPRRVEALLRDGVWTTSDLQPYAVVVAVPFEIPDGMQTVGAERFEDVGGVPHQVYNVEAIAPPVPDALTPLQARRALRAMDLKTSLDAYVATLPEEDQEAWEYAIEVRRDSPLVLAGAAHLGWSDQLVDDLFRLGATL